MGVLGQHKILIIVAVVLIAGGVWYGLSQSSEPAPLLTTDTGTPGALGSPTLEGEDQQIVATLLTLRAVTLSSAIFSDPAFMSLKDFTQAIRPEPVGRENPFAPLSGAAAATSNSTQSAQIFAPGR